MKKAALIVALAIVFLSVQFGSAYAHDDFEHGFRLELGAIAARSVVGLGVGAVNGVLGGGVAYNGLYVRPAPVYHPRHERVVYVYPPPPPPPVYYEVERRYVAPYPPPPPPVVYKTYEYHYYYH